VAVVALVGIRPPARQQAPHLGRLRQARGRTHFLDGLRGDADVDDGERPGVLDARVEHVPELGEAEGCGGLRLHRRTERYTAVGIESRRNVDGKHRCPRAVEQLDDIGGEAVHRGVEPGAEDRIDRQRGFRDPFAQAGEILAGQDLVHRAATLEKALQIARRVTAQIALAAEQGHARPHAAFAQQARHHQAVTAVVALAGDDDDLTAAHVRKPAQQRRGGALPRPLHEHVPGRALLDGPLVEAAHLGGRDEDHVDPRASRAPWSQ